MNSRADAMDHNAAARALAFEQVAAPQPQVPVVSYTSSGQLLIIGPGQAVSSAADKLTAPGLDCTLLITDSDKSPGTLEEQADRHVVHGRVDSLSGYLGDFSVQSDNELLIQALKLALPKEMATFDLVLDLSETPYIGSEIPPPGYYPAPGNDSEVLAAALEQIPGLVGDFEKPRYFRYNASICAHGRSGIDGCSRCIETCPTDAISANGDVITVNPNLCQGAGSCATACPTGAITYGYPPVADTLQYWRSLLRAYHGAGGESAVLLVHDGESGRVALERIRGRLGGHVLPLEVEELGSVGPDAWLAALAWGASAVKLLSTSDIAASVRAELDFQIEVVRCLLTGMGYSQNRIGVVSEAEAVAATTSDLGADITPTEFAAIDEKRTLMRLALDHLFSRAPQPSPVIALPDGAPFGEIRIDAERCTLCMACVSQCPANALAAGDDSPQLRLVEAKCVQCGVCAHSCPEKAISLSSRWLGDSEQRTRLRTLHEDAPFCCVRCGKPFATRSVIARITDKVKDHPMFSGDALERLKMCEDCRVRDIYSTESARD